MVVTARSATTIDVAIMEDGYYFHGPFAGAQLWVDEDIAFRDHVAFDAQAYMKFDIGRDLASINAEDITTAILEFTTLHKNENIPNRTWGSPPNGTNATLAVEPYAAAVDMNLTIEPDTVSGENLTYPHVCYDIAGAVEGEKLETIQLDVTKIVKNWLAANYDNHGFRLDLLGALPADKYYMWVFTSESSSYIPALKVTVDESQSEAPAVDISVSKGVHSGGDNAKVFVPGDTMQVVLKTSPVEGGNNDSWNLYVGLILPQNIFYTVSLEPALGFTRHNLPDDLKPARPLVPIVSESVTILNVTLPPGILAGEYQWLAILEKDNWSKMSRVSQETFTLAIE